MIWKVLDAKRRDAAEARLKARQASSIAALKPDDLPRLVHELQVHQIELELQNEELQSIQQALNAERANYFDLYNLAPVGYYTLDGQGLIRQANLAVASLLGVSCAALIDQPLSRFVLEDDAGLYTDHYRQLLATNKPAVCELRILRHGEAPFWAHLAARVGHESDGSTLLRVMLSDIDDRKHAEEALREQNLFFQLIAKNIADFIAVLDPEGRRLYTNPAYTRFFGPGQPLPGSDSFANIHPQDREYVEQVFRETVQSGRGRQIAYRLLLADGSIREMESRGNVIKDDQGRVMRVVVVSHDVTERKRLEEQVRQMAFHDVLTKLPNRRLLTDRLRQCLSASARSACHGAVMFLDLDNFKPLNDRHGHSLGDLLLIEVAERLKRCVREMDTVARFGGDEFVVMISELDVDEAESIAQARAIGEKIRVALAEPYRLIANQAGRPETTIEHHCTVSIGVALFVDHHASQEDILKSADTAMYQAKGAGRNAIAVFDPQARSAAALTPAPGSQLE